MSDPLNKTFHALADPTRRAILDRLSHGPMPVTSLSHPFKMALPSFMKHLSVLEDAGLIETRKEGRKRWCALSVDGLRLGADWLAEAQEVWGVRLARYAEMVEEE